jgi:hypothetical protein
MLLEDHGWRSMPVETEAAPNTTLYPPVSWADNVVLSVGCLKGVF